MIDQAIQYMSAPAYMPTLFNAGMLLCWLFVALILLRVLDKRLEPKKDKAPTLFQVTFHEADANYRMVYYTGRLVAVLWCGVQILPV